MPYKSEKIKIEGTMYDRRRKLSEETKEYIRWLRKEERISYGKLANMFNVSKRLIIFICRPETQEKVRENFKKSYREGRLSKPKEYWKEVTKEHRRYKQKLYKDGLI